MTFVEAVRRHIEDREDSEPVPQDNPLLPKLVPFGT